MTIAVIAILLCAVIIVWHSNSAVVLLRDVRDELKAMRRYGLGDEPAPKAPSLGDFMKAAQDGRGPASVIEQHEQP